MNKYMLSHSRYFPGTTDSPSTMIWVMSSFLWDREELMWLQSLALSGQGLSFSEGLCMVAISLGVITGVLRNRQACFKKIYY